jgi:glutamine synthetase
MDNKILLEYVWLDGYSTQNLRSKVKVVNIDSLVWHGDDKPDVKSLPIWDFDGSSTQQAPGDNSECHLVPVRIYQENDEQYLVMCEVFQTVITNKNGTFYDGIPHISNQRAQLRSKVSNADQQEFWWGFEQEYFIRDEKGNILGWPSLGHPRPQGEYYCAVGGNSVTGRSLAELHLGMCLSRGIELTGINAEVALGQWEYQCFAKDTLKACDDLWMSRYLLNKASEYDNYSIDISPKPVKGDWNGSGCHTNFSFKAMREDWSKEQMEDLMDSFGETHYKHIAEYGENNDQRLTGNHETQYIGEFSWGVGDRGASIRVPTSVENNGWNGYIEDRRPASNCDPYAVARLIIETSTDLC